MIKDDPDGERIIEIDPIRHLGRSCEAAYPHCPQGADVTGEYLPIGRGDAPIAKSVYTVGTGFEVSGQKSIPRG